MAVKKQVMLVQEHPLLQVALNWAKAATIKQFCFDIKKRNEGIIPFKHQNYNQIISAKIKHMNCRNKIFFLTFFLAPFVFILSCKKSSTATEVMDATTPTSTFTASSNAFTNNGIFPKLYTCDSTGISPKLSWANAPVGTASYAITMHHIPPTPPNHVYMLLYNIPVTTTAIADAVSGIGIFGINTVNGLQSYTPPCSQGPGAKLYTITVYALSSAPVFSAPASQVTMDIFLAAISTKTLATSTINVTYTR